VFLLVDLIGVFRASTRAGPRLPLASVLLRTTSSRFLPHYDELASGVEVDDVTRDAADIDDVADHSGSPSPHALCHVDLLGTNRDAAVASSTFEMRRTRRPNSVSGCSYHVCQGCRSADAPLSLKTAMRSLMAAIFLIVRDVDERDAEVLRQRLQEDLHLLAQLQVERTRARSFSIIEQHVGRLTIARASATRGAGHRRACNGCAHRPGETYALENLVCAVA